MLALFGHTICLSSALLFVVQPMIGKMVLPYLGGSPAVWNTCMVFFQAALLAGYAYAHLLSARFPVRWQLAIHLTVLAAPFLCLPIMGRFSAPVPGESNPVGWLLLVLAMGVGLPFFAVSTTNPLLQKWFALTGHPAAHDPYFLYAASNFGSMAALVSYPLVVEAFFPLAAQSRLWTAGFVVLAASIAMCGLLALRARSAIDEPPVLIPSAGAADEAGGISGRRRLRWVMLAMAPSSLMLGVTTYITTDIASVPLFWIVPLSLYLLSFILVYARRPPIPHDWMSRTLPWLALPLAASFFADAGWLLIGLHVATFFVAAMVCHGELARNRPTTRWLTEYYFWMSLGGVLGGLFNALLAPLVFPTILEYPLTIIAACALCPARRPVDDDPFQRELDIGVPIALALGIVLLAWSLRNYSWESNPWLILPLLALPAAICFTFIERPVRYALGLGAVMLSGGLYVTFRDPVLHLERSFFGVHRVVFDRQSQTHKLKHGGTFHGWQFVDADQRGEPVAYFHRRGPLGDVMRVLGEPASERHIGAIGLGTGAIAAYHRPGTHITFFEIDPVVKRLAENPELFTYLSDVGPSAYTVELSDGRLAMSRAPDQSFDLILLDAFSSDMIPVHLLTSEAVNVYLDKLATGGIMVFHVSNRFLDLEPVLADLAAAKNLVCIAKADLEITDADRASGKAASHYVALARSSSDFRGLDRLPGWRSVLPRPDVRIWTDDYSNLVRAFRW
jgi:hypothetical protein